MTKAPDLPAGNDRWQWSFEAHQRRQARLGLQLTPAERLRWLETTVEAMRRIQGRAREHHRDKD